MIPNEVKTAIKNELKKEAGISCGVDEHLIEREFLKRCTRNTFAFKNPTTQAAKVLKALRARHNGVFGNPPDTFIIATNNKTLGYLKVQTIQENIINLVSIWIRPNRRGDGFFDAEVKFLCELADQYGVAVVAVPCPFEPKLVDGSETPERFAGIVAANIGDCGAVTKPDNYLDSADRLRATYLNRGFRPFLWWPSMAFGDEALRSKAVAYLPDSFSGDDPETDEFLMLLECGAIA